MDTLKRLGEADFKVGVTCVVTARNIDQVVDMAHYYADLGYISRVSFSQMAASRFRYEPELFAPDEQLRALEKTMHQIRSQYDHISINYTYIEDCTFMDQDGRRAFHSDRPTCSGGKWSFTLLPDGKVTLCEQLYYHEHFLVGDLRKQSIEEMWHSPEMMKVVRPDQSEFTGSPCHTCKDFRACHDGRGRCWTRALKAYADKSKPELWPDPYCPIAPETERRLS
jgi:radical SAM protein with 4Fe4S-binding SPASM domain